MTGRSIFVTKEQSRNANLIRRLFWIAIVVCVAGIVVKAVSIFYAASVWDDALMFVRYADNILGQGKVSWNPSGDPTYGLTSLLYLLVVVPVRLAFPGKPLLSASLSSFLSGLVFLVLIVVLILRYTDGTVWVRRGLLLFVLIVFFSSAEALAVHFVSGMDTAFVLAYVTALILLAKMFEQSPSIWNAVWLGLVGGLAFFARPDLLLYSFAIPFSLIAFASNNKTRRGGFLVLMIVLWVVLVQIAFAFLYFQSPLPLSFYAKSMHLYGDFIYQKYRLIPIQEFYDFVTKSYWLFFLPIAINLSINFRNWWRTAAPVDKGLVLGTIFFLFYYLFFALQIMYYDQRFYFPTVPAISFLAAQSIGSMLKKLSSTVKLKVVDILSGILDSRWSLVVLAMFTFGMLAPTAISVSVGMISALAGRSVLQFDLVAAYQTRLSDFWYRLDEFSALPDDLVLATTEVGYPAAMNPHKTIVDLSGLNETNFAHNGFSSRFLLVEYKPDLIYLPFPDYKEMIGQILNAPGFQLQYDYYSAKSLGVLMGVALRRHSPYYVEMKNIVDKGIRR